MSENHVFVVPKWSHVLFIVILTTPTCSLLHSSNYAGTATVAECLLLLAKGPEWRPAISLKIGECLDTLPQTLDLSGMFGLLVTAGFPKVREKGDVKQRR